MPTRSPLRSVGALIILPLLAALTLALGLVGPLASPAGAEERRDAPRMPAECFAPAQTAGEPGPCFLTPFRGTRPTVVLWGDSHAYQYVPALRRAVNNRDVNLVSFVAGSCPPVVVTRSPQEGYNGKCERNNDLALDFVKARMARRADVVVILGSNWSGFRRAYQELYVDRTAKPGEYSSYTQQMVRLSHRGTPRLFDTLGDLRVPVEVIGQAATVPEGARVCGAGYDPYLCDIPRRQAIPDEGPTRRWLRAQSAQLAGSPQLIDTTGVYCSATVCHGLIGRTETFFDRLHLSATRTKTMWTSFRGIVVGLRR